MIVSSEVARNYFSAIFSGVGMKGRRALTLCCFHHERTPSLSLNLETGQFKCFGCGVSGDLIDFHRKLNPNLSFVEAKNALGTDITAVPIIPQLRNSQREENRGPILDTIWRSADALQNGDAADVYLRSRGINLNRFPEVLRLHPRLEYWERASDGNWEKHGEFPALIARVESDSGELLGLHRIYLSEGGRKAHVRHPKKLMSVSPGSTRGGAVRLFTGNSGTIALAEGLETALAYHRLSTLPVWATVSANGMERVILPSQIKTVHICVDIDLSGRGQLAADRLSQRLTKEGRTVYKAAPPGRIPEGAKSLDWCTILDGLHHEYKRD